ncbi:mechanosensitive ion channel domain-containing protein [Rhodobacteraceae bacterium DSL-40]|uniref:mechanosensitive ion channel family protein n=1 Tax=Amaricoccus sp. B4 TaxID=3368557 RepID=UPI0013A6EBE9
MTLQAAFRHFMVLALVCLLSLAAAPRLMAQAADGGDAAQPSAEAPAAEPEAGEAPADEAEAEAAPDLNPGLTSPDTDQAAFVLLLQPLTQDDLAKLADIWLGIVKHDTEQVVDAQIAAMGDKGEDAAAQIEPLTDTRNAAFTKYAAVLDAWEKKGGDAATIAPYRSYRSAIIIEEKRNATIETLALEAWHWAIDREGGLHFVVQGAIIIGALLALVIVAGTVRRIARRGVGRIPNLSKLLQAFIVMIIYWLTIAIGLMVVLSSLGIDITPVFALIGGASFIMAFAMQDTLGNLAAGLMIMINRPFDEGDYVDIGGVAGTVKSVSIVSTMVTTPDNQVIVVPNSKVWGNVITNVTASPTRRVDLVFGIGYDDSIEAAQTVLERVVAEHPMVLSDPAPTIRVNALGASSVDFICRPWVRGADYWTVYWDLTRQVKQAFDAEGISIPYPQTDMHLHVAGGAAAPAALPLGPAAAGTGRPTGAKDYAAGDDGHGDDDDTSGS